MKILRTLLLGSAGAAVLFTAGTVAQAADSPEAVKGREPVWRCDTAGFIEYPGSDVCFKIGGYVAAWVGGADENWTTGEDIDEYGIHDDVHPLDDTFWMGALGRFNIDIRQATELGVVRAFIETWAFDGNTPSSGTFGLRHAFIQVGNWLVGKTWSTFRSAPGTPELWTEPLGAVGDLATVRVVQVRYTFNVGNGVTFNVAIEDQAFFTAAFDPSGYAAVDSRNEMPDFVANIQVRGSWGSAQLSGALHRDSYIVLAGASAGSDREFGWATQLSIALNVPGTMGDVIYLAGGYADGHMGAIDTGAAFSWHAHAGHAGESVDAVTGWSVVGGWEHYWRETLRSTFAASYVDNDYPDFPDGDAIDTAMSVWANLIWTAAPKLDLGVEVIWGRNERMGGEDADAIAVVGQARRDF